MLAPVNPRTTFGLCCLPVLFWVEFQALSTSLKAVGDPWILLYKSKAERSPELSALASETNAALSGLVEG